MKAKRTKAAKNAKEVRMRQAAPLKTPNRLGANATNDIAGALTTLLADMFALYLKTKNFHWHVSGPHFRSLHLLFDEQAAQIFGTTDAIAERARKVGGMTLRSIGHVAGCNALPTTTRNTSHRWTSWRSCGRTTWTS